jgi:hypothetical protein
MQALRSEDFKIQRSLIRRRDRAMTGVMRESLRVIRPEVDRLLKRGSSNGPIANPKSVKPTVSSVARRAQDATGWEGVYFRRDFNSGNFCPRNFT